MEPDPAYACSVQEPAKVTVEVAGFDRSPNAGGEDQPGILPVLAGDLAFSALGDPSPLRGRVLRGRWFVVRGRGRRAVLARRASPRVCQPTPAKVRVPTMRVVSSSRWSTARRAPGCSSAWSSCRRKATRVSRRSWKASQVAAGFGEEVAAEAEHVCPAPQSGVRVGRRRAGPRPADDGSAMLAEAGVAAGVAGLGSAVATLAIDAGAPLDRADVDRPEGRCGEGDEHGRMLGDGLGDALAADEAGAEQLAGTRSGQVNEGDGIQVASRVAVRGPAGSWYGKIFLMAYKPA